MPKNKTMKVSFAIIAKNEKNSITKCLESLKGADEIVVCDTGSEDNTIEIAKKYTDKIFTDYKWNDDFAEARNYAISKCSGDWIFTIDCDCILKTSLEQIKKEIELAEKEGFKAVSVKCQDINTPTNHCLPLVYKNDPEVKWYGEAHNYLSVDGRKQEQIQIDYYYSDSHAKDPDRTFRILKKVVAKKPDCVREKFYLARDYWYRNDYITAIYWYHEYLKVAYFGPEMADAYLTCARCYWYLQKGDLARAMCLEAIALNTNFKEALQFMAEMSGPGNKKRWLEFAQTANNQGILFIRT